MTRKIVRRSPRALFGMEEILCGPNWERGQIQTTVFTKMFLQLMEKNMQGREFIWERWSENVTSMFGKQLLRGLGTNI